MSLKPIIESVRRDEDARTNRGCSTYARLYSKPPI